MQDNKVYMMPNSGPAIGIHQVVVALPQDVGSSSTDANNANEVPRAERETATQLFHLSDEDTRSSSSAADEELEMKGTAVDDLTPSEDDTRSSTSATTSAERVLHKETANDEPLTEQSPPWRDGGDLHLQEHVGDRSSDKRSSQNPFDRHHHHHPDHPLWKGPSKLYDRDEEEAQLKAAFERCIMHTNNNSTTRPPELVLVTGPSGTGKTSLTTQTLRPIVEAAGGFFVQGKFDQLERPENYYPIVHCFTDFVGMVLEQRDEETLQSIQKVVKDFTETEPLLMDLIPALELLFDSNDSSCRQHHDAKGANAKERLVFAFRQFIRAICSKWPLVLFLDDLQWAEPLSLDLLAALVCDADIQGLMVVGACRPNEVSMDHHLSVTLRELESCYDAVITNIVLDDFHCGAVSEMISDVLQLPKQQMQPLADLVYRQTAGNIFFVIQFLRTLYEEGLLYQDTTGSEPHQWVWEPETKIMDRLNYDNAGILLAGKIRRLDKNVQEVLMVAASLGNEFDEYLLHEIVTFDVAEPLQVAEEKGLIRLEACGTWRFVHDQIQQSAYSLIPDHEKEEVHLQIGRKLWNSLSSDQLNLHAFLVVNQLRLGAHLVTDQDERDRMAVLMLRAGEKATTSSAFMTAASYLELGTSLLARRHWRDQYELSLGLYNALSEVEYCNGRFTRMDELIREILENARNDADKDRALTASIYSLGSRNELQKAIDLGLKVLQDLDETFPTKPNVFTIVFELRKTKRMLRHLTDEDILKLPHMQDPKKLSAMRIMNLMFAYTLNGRPMYAPLISMRLVQRSIKYGMCSMACGGFSFFGMFLCNVFGEVDVGIRYGGLSLKIMEEFQSTEWLPRTYSAVYGFCFTFKEPLCSQLKPLLIAHRTGLGSGDIEFSMLCAALYAGIGVNASVHLPQLLADMSAFLGLMKLHNQINMIQFIRPSMQFVQNMIGCENPSELNGDFMNEEKAMAEAQLEKNATIVAFIHLTKLMLSSYFRNFQDAEKAAIELSKCNCDSFACFSRASQWLHAGLTSVALSDKNRRQRMGVAKRNLRKLKSLARYSKHNFFNKVLLLEAAVYEARGRFHQALMKYDEAICQAKEAELWNEVGLAYEWAAIALKRRGRMSQSVLYFKNAIAAYDQWGARAKMANVMEMVPVSHAIELSHGSGFSPGVL